MKIKVLKSCSGYHFSFTAGQEYDVTSEIGNDLVGCGFAEKAEEPKKKQAAKAKENADD